MDTQTASLSHPHLLTIFLGGLLGGFAAVLLPCIFPMLPLTVGFFTKRHQNRRKGIIDALIYGLSIIVIYVGLGILITILFGADDSDIQARQFNANAQPFYVLLDPSTQQPLAAPKGADYDPAGYAAYLKAGITSFGK
ncbi:hypothetical protein L3C95_14550 [Chitinophaga filiformis]|uniref:cytochrome c biogenesis protein CcdA n=1 Tax=Chitinophaga filiformis TaxID=104663 RepID=UPI001F434902|nr:hypothetical protein [Chitinophaga filiformis]MCF6404111.1 hypothetical protein [Chitinophaga filiformis]